MKLIVERTEMLKSWQIAQRYTPPKTAMESLNGIRITASAEGGIMLEASDLKSSVKYPVEGNVVEAGEAVLNASIFGDMLKKSDAEYVEVATTSRQGTLTTVNSRMRFTVIAGESFPNLPDSSEAEEICEVYAPDLVCLVVEGCSAAGQPSEFPKYMGTCLLRTSNGKLTVASTDGRRLACSERESDVKVDVDLVLPASDLKELVKSLKGTGYVKVKANDALVWLEASGAEYSLRRLEATFPKYEKILKDTVSSTLRVKREVIISAMERVAVIAKNATDRLMSMTLSPDGGMTLRARAVGIGTTQEVVSGAKVSGTEMSIGFNVNLLLAGLIVVSSDEVLIEFSGADEQARIYDADSRDFLYMLMPMRVTASDMSDDVDEAEVEPEKGDEANGE